MSGLRALRSLRTVSLLLLSLMPSLLVSVHARAQEPYPARPVRVVVGVPPGSGADTITRAIALQLSQQWARSVVVDNRPGAGGSIAMDLVARSPSDGYTLLSASVGLVATARLLKKVSFDPGTTFEPIIEMTSQPYVVIVSPAAPFRSVRDLIAYARSHPGEINYASSGKGSASHLGTELFKSMAGIDLTHVPYKGLAQGLNELAAGQVQVLFSTFVSSLTYIKSARVYPIAVATRKRMSAYPSLRTVAESGVPGFELSSAYALYAPAKTPQPLIRKINEDVTAVLERADVRARLTGDGAEMAERNTPAQFKIAFTKEVARWEGLVKSSAAARDALVGKP